MGGLVGIVRLDGQAVDRAIIDRWKKGGGGLSPGRVRAGDCWAFAHERGPAQFESRAPQPFELSGGRRLFVESRLDDLVVDTDSGEAVAELCERKGADACAEIHGDFAYAYWDPAERRLTLARDALGARSLYYVFDGQRVAFATSIHLLLALPDTPRDLDELGIADMFIGATDQPERTLYRHIRRVLPGGTASFTPGACTAERYWTLDRIAPVRFARDEDYVEAARALFERAVAARLPAEGPVAAMLSGGFDSAGVVATAARMLGERRLTAYTRVAGAPHPYTRFDEQGLAGQAAAMYPNIDWVVVDDLHIASRDTSPDWEAAASGVPTNGFARTWFEPIHDRVAASGASVLLAGRLGNATLSWSGAGLAHELLEQGHWLGAVREVLLDARRRERPLAGALRSALTPLIEPQALRRWRKARQPRWQQLAAISPDFLEDVAYREHSDSIGHDMLRFLKASGPELRMFLLQSRSDEGAHARSRRGHAMLDPYADRTLAEFTLGIPESQFKHGGVRRWLARRVLADRLPAELLAQDRRGKQVAEWYTLATMRREHTAEEVERIGRSPLASRVLDVPRLKALVDSWPADAEAARATEREHRFALHQGVTIGSFLRWHEGGNG